MAKTTDNTFDVIVVGAGPAGTAAALTCARAGLTTVMLERGNTPGAKNVMGGIIYSYPLAELLPEYAATAPLERPIIEESMWLTAPQSALSIGFRSYDFLEAPTNYSVLRVKFDKWFAEQAEAAGAMLVTETVVEDCIKEQGRVVGVATDRPDGDLYANVVIAADGAISLLAQKAGLRADAPIAREYLVQGVKEVIALDAAEIEKRFRLPQGKGCTIEMVGDIAKGMAGFGWMYTNKDSISLGIGCLLLDFIKHKMTPNQLLEHMKGHPMVAPLIEGGTTIEYSGHMIPEGGLASMPKLAGNGILVAGDAAMMINAVHREGSNLAMESGRLAGQAAVAAHEARDFSARSLARYEALLDGSFVMKDLRKYKRVPKFLKDHHEPFTVYPALLNEAAHEMIKVDGVSKREKQNRIIKNIIKTRGLWNLVKDGWTMFRTFA